jgi:hypothetical protein
MKRQSLILLAMAVGIGIALPLMSQKKEIHKEVRRHMFLPPPLTDDWSKWIVGEWEGSGESDTGKGRGTARVQLALNGQFLIHRGEAKITELNPEYLKKHMQASDSEIERFKRSGYESLEIYTTDQETGEVIGFLFDNLRCMATGRGKREGLKEIMEWEWRTGHRSTRITEKVSDDRLVVIERTPNPDGSMMEDKGEMTRSKPRSVSERR